METQGHGSIVPLPSEIPGETGSELTVDTWPVVVQLSPSPDIAKTIGRTASADHNIPHRCPRLGPLHNSFFQLDSGADCREKQKETAEKERETAKHERGQKHAT